MKTVMLCDNDCGGTLDMVPGRGVVCSNGCTFDHLGAVRRAAPRLLPAPLVEAIEEQPIDLRPRWRPCGCIRTPENYVTRTSGGVTYSGCRDCWEAVAS